MELDGRLGHEKHRDYRRDNRNVINHNVVTLRYGWYDVTDDPCGVAAQVGRCLRMRGWQGDVRRCRRCRRLPG